MGDLWSMLFTAPAVKRLLESLVRAALVALGATIIARGGLEASVVNAWVDGTVPIALALLWSWLDGGKGVQRVLVALRMAAKPTPTPADLKAVEAERKAGDGI